MNEKKTVLGMLKTRAEDGDEFSIKDTYARSLATDRFPSIKVREEFDNRDERMVYTVTRVMDNMFIISSRILEDGISS